MGSTNETVSASHSNTVASCLYVNAKTVKGNSPIVKAIPSSIVMSLSFAEDKEEKEDALSIRKTFGDMVKEKTRSLKHHPTTDPNSPWCQISGWQ